MRQIHGVDDAAPVTHENFRQWVIEDDFCAGRPDWNFVGAEFSAHVHQHEARKIRVLNGGHQILANVAEIVGVESIADAMADPLIHALFRKVQTEEIIPHVKPLSGSPVMEYLDLIDRRFSNDAIIDTVRRVAFDARRAMQDSSCHQFVTGWQQGNLLRGWLLSRLPGPGCVRVPVKMAAG